MNYYNEWDPQAAAWLRELIENKLIPEGVVDERSITEVQAKDLKGFTQCHFFAGIGGWPLALQLAGVPATTRLWTGSPPCQPFSAAGKQLGQYDPRHLAPVFLGLISQCRPAILFGEQVAPAIAKSWMCDLQTHLEGEDYSVGFAVLPACGVGAPHKRERLFFGAHRLANADGNVDGGAEQGSYGAQESAEAGNWPRVTESGKSGRNGADVRRVAYGDDDRQQSGSRRRRSRESPGPGNDVGRNGAPDKLADTDGKQRNRGGGERSGRRIESANGGRHNTTDPHHGFWSDADWLGCRDGKFRPVESGTFPLANGIPARVGRLRGYGNAIVPQVAAEFIKAFMAAKAETETKA